jgi:hypothetical protein
MRAHSKIGWLYARKWFPLALALASFALYLRTLAPDVVDADGGQFQFAAWTFGFVHPTGYPLFLILGGAFQHLVPIGNPAFRLNLLNALIAALAVAMLYLAVNELTRARGAAIVAAASFALTRTFWYDASAVEVYALHTFFVALLLYIALRWQPTPTARALAAFCFVFGLALTHHRAIVLWVPAFLAFAVASCTLQFSSSKSNRLPPPASCLLSSASRLLPPASRLLLPVACLLLPLLLYLYVPLRAPAAPYYALVLAPGRDLILYDNSPAGFINYMLGRTFQSEIAWDAVSVARLLAFPQLLLDQFGALGVALGALGFAVMPWRRDGARLALLLIGFLTTILFASLYHIGDIAHYYIPAYLVWAMWIGVGAALLLPNGIRNTQYIVRIAYCVLLVGMLVVQLVVNFPYADRSHETQHRERWTRVLSAPIPPNAILVSNDRDEMMPLWYIQYVENTRRDVLGLFPRITPAPEFANIARVTDTALSTQRPVFFIKPMPGIEIKYRLEAMDGLWRVSVQSRAPQQSSDAVLANRVRVLGFDATREGDALRIAIYWSPLVKLNRDYTTFIHLLDARGNKVAQGNDHQVGGVFYPTTLWEIGETLRDEFVIALPPDLVTGLYTLVAGMYVSPEIEMLGEPVVVGTIQVTKGE